MKSVIMMLAALAILSGCKTIPMNGKERGSIDVTRPDVPAGCPDCEDPPMPPPDK